MSQEVIGHTAVQIKQYRITGIFALDKDPLRHTVDVDISLLGNATGQRLAILVYEGLRLTGAPRQQKTH
ncbi:MAG: hypothetical protein R2867_44310 [Caldilineaceae bacterium]